jgi:hypothetical protein
VTLQPGRPALLGRRMRSPTGPQSPGSHAYGNAPPVTYDPRGGGQPANVPEGGTGGALTGSQSMGGLRLPMEQEPGPWYNPGGRGGAYGGGWADGKLTLRDRFIQMNRGTVRHSASPANGVSPVNPEADGPARPEYLMVDNTASWQIGTDSTRNLDNPGPHNSVAVDGEDWRQYPLGQQDGSQTVVFGPPLGSWREYGVRGPQGMHGPAPDIYNPNTRGKPALVQQGEPGTQPQDRRLVYGGVPHGLHSPTANSTLWTGARYANTPQMTAPRVDRPASSKVAGQSFSQTVVSQANSGGSVQQTPRMPDPGRSAGIGSRFVSRR